MKIVIGSVEDIKAYGEIPISFETHGRVDLDFLGTGVIRAIPTETRWKDYDEIAEECPAHLAKRGDVGCRVILLAFEGTDLVGGIVVTYPNHLDGFDQELDSAAVADLRIHPNWRRNGIGKALWIAAEDWARQKGIQQLMVETQDINVAACKFYQSMGCEIRTINPAAYSPELNEVQLIWQKHLGTN